MVNTKKTLGHVLTILLYMYKNLQKILWYFYRFGAGKNKNSI